MDHRTTESASKPIGQEAVPMLDLQQFCSIEPWRPYLMQPFSRDGYTWATNGHILVRVTLRPEFPDIDQKMNQAKPLDGIESAVFSKPAFDLPARPAETLSCTVCEGRGLIHDCPDCECECETCDGGGQMNPERRMSASVGSKIFSLHYVRQVLSLPGIEIAIPTEQDENPLLFRFQDGVGALMPMRGERSEHIDILPSKDRKIT